MSNEIFFGKNSFRFFYYRYKDSAYYSISIIAVTIISCVLLIFGFVIPQFEQWFSIRNEVLATRERTDIINNNISYMNTLDKNQLINQLQASVTALPTEKNFGAILESLNMAAIRSGVSFQDYSFQVGKVASGAAQLDHPEMPGIAAISVSVIVNGTFEDVRKFLKEMGQTLPLSNVVSVDGASGAITVSFDFFQKNLPTATLQDDQPIPRVAETNAVLLNKLVSWQTMQPVTGGGGNASSSAIPLF